MIRREFKIRFFLTATILAVVALFAFQGLLVKWRFDFLDAKFLDLRQAASTCVNSECTSEWHFNPSYKYVVVGHILRSHSVSDLESGRQILPVSRVRGTSTDSWNMLRVYEVTPGREYIMTAVRPEASRAGTFIGVLPRESNHDGVLSVPDISPTVSLMSILLSISILAVLIFAALQAQNPGIEGIGKRNDLQFALGASAFATLFSLLSSGILDSILPEGEIRSRLLRSSLCIALGTYPLGLILRKIAAKGYFPKFVVGWKLVQPRIFIPVSAIALGIIVNLAWSLFRAGISWSVTVGGLTILFGIVMLFARQYLAAMVIMLGAADAFRILGLVIIGDSPPVFLNQISIAAGLAIWVLDLGALDAIAMVTRAYQRLSRDRSISMISQILHANAQGIDEGDISEAVKVALPKISELTGAGRVTIMINLPLSRPITHGYNAKNQKEATYDDGKIPGVATVRSFVYGDEHWFESYEIFAQNLGLPTNSDSDSGRYICIAPIPIQGVNMGVISLTGFDDHLISNRIKNGEIKGDKETVCLVIAALANAFSRDVIHSMRQNSLTADELLAKVREAVVQSTTQGEFFERYLGAISETLSMRAILHQWIEDRGVAIASSQFSTENWESFKVAPFNLSPTAVKSYGPIVIAFREHKASYLKDWREIREELHPKSVTLLESLDAGSMIAVPLRSGDNRFVVTVMTRAAEKPQDPGVTRIIAATEAIFDAAFSVFNQRASVLALGKLANRLIGDNEVREKIVEAAKGEKLQTTIGSPRTSFLLLFDLVGSSHLSTSTEEKAAGYGRFYDEVNQAAGNLLGGKVRKTIGDAVIITWDGTETRLEETVGILEAMDACVLHADKIAKEIGCRGVRAILHYGDYFFGLVGTASFGQIDVIGRGIDEVCKAEGTMKLLTTGGYSAKIAITNGAVKRLERLKGDDYRASGFLGADMMVKRSVNPLFEISWVKYDSPEVGSDHNSYGQRKIGG